MSTFADYAARYIHRFDMAITLLDGKKPIWTDWNTDARLIRDSQQVREYLRLHPLANIGACLEPSRLCSVDCDQLEYTRAILAAEGIDLDALMAATPTIVGRAPRLEFKAPEGIALQRKAIKWPTREDLKKTFVVMELRAGRCQDVLPPSIHPDKRRPYRWATPPVNGFPPLPERLLSIWLNFDAFKQRARSLCPWAPPEIEKAPRPAATRRHTGPSVIRAFNEAHDVVTLLESHGYAPAGKRRWRSPSGHGMAGVVLLPDGQRIFCHHASDPLGDDKPHDAFDLFVHFDHCGDVRAATRAAAKMLGMEAPRG